MSVCERERSVCVCVCSGGKGGGVCMCDEYVRVSVYLFETMPTCLSLWVKVFVCVCQLYFRSYASFCLLQTFLAVFNKKKLIKILAPNCNLHFAHQTLHSNFLDLFHLNFLICI